MRVQTLVVPTALMLSMFVPNVVRSQNKGAPESFTANLNVTGATAGAGAATIQIQVQRYTPDADRTAVEAALKSGGYPAFLAALRKAPEAGTVTAGDQKWVIRWAREQTVPPRGRTIVLVTDRPIFFVGGGRVDAKPREGYDVGVIRLQMDDAGLGNGSMAPAAKVKASPETGVEVEDYGGQNVKLVSVVRKLQ